MDLRRYKMAPQQIEIAKDLACRGLLCYQPFIFSEQLQTGAGYEFAKIAEGAGLVYCLDPPKKYAGIPEVERHLIDPKLFAEFADYNQRLRVLYETFIETIEQKVGPISQLELADVGCCSGYFPMSFAKRGAKRAVGYDNIDYTESFKLLNAILGTNAEFHPLAYDPYQRCIPGADTFDVVVSIAVLVHLSDPLEHLAFLGKMARKALLIWTWTAEDAPDQLVIRYVSVNRYYSEAKFPYCFDVVQISPGLLYKSLELMGFTEIHQVTNRPEGMPDYWFNRHRGYLAIRR